MRAPLERLRTHAVTQTLFRPTSLKRAIQQLGFVQADPIRSPARAQDLILRHRVNGYHAGDLERRYPSLDIEEDVLYAYGFMPRTTWQLLHPRNTTGLDDLEKKVLDLVMRNGETHPRELELSLGRERAVNLWGGYSKATTRALEALHYRGLLRIARRDNGIRVYRPVPRTEQMVPATERLRVLILLLARIFAPVPETSLRAVVNHLRHSATDPGSQRIVLRNLLKSGELQSAEVDGLTYIWPPETMRRKAPAQVRFLAPFDPVVWDRRRFEHLWGWAYRFEAYTPAAKRQLGYYAMPLLWGNRVIGWANVSSKDGRLHVKTGFVEKPPGEPEFARALDEEIERMSLFLSGADAHAGSASPDPSPQNHQPRDCAANRRNDSL